jgi:hypothetical protein
MKIGKERKNFFDKWQAIVMRLLNTLETECPNLPNRISPIKVGTISADAPTSHIGLGRD